MTYFLHGAGEIRHMLLMGWGGETIRALKFPVNLHHELRRSTTEFHSLGVLHGDLNDGNLLWNSELKRILIIDFHDMALDPALKKRQLRAKRKLVGPQYQEQKRLRMALV
jgi:tRNA A-37 threonylcarbamoyl transferase component Bud32